MGIDNLAKRRRDERKARISKEQKLRAETWLIVCEGTETESNYFNSLLEHVNTLSVEKIKFKIVGTGKNTKSLVNGVESLFNTIGNEISKKMIRYGKVFVTFDKDDFSKVDFNDAVRMCENKGYIALWSNECFELWFLLHFNYLDTAITRKEYYVKLKHNLKVDYLKNADNFSLLGKLDRIPKAYAFAKKLESNFDCNDQPADRKPCTMVYKIIDEIETYTGVKLKD